MKARKIGRGPQKANRLILSKLQKLILVTLLDPQVQTRTLIQFNQYVYIKHYNRKRPTNAQKAILSRSYRRLQAQGLITRDRRSGIWRLTNQPALMTGYLSGKTVALDELQKHPERYPQVY
jgi:hypothetical protein